MLQQAEGILESEGAEALTVREVAKRAGISVQGVYTLFGGKSGLCEALFTRAFAALQSTLDEVGETEDATDAVISQAMTYRRYAVDNPHHYALMFAHPIPDFTPSVAARTAASSTFVSLVEALRRVLPASDGSSADDMTPERAALVVWALNHGLVTLEQDGVIADDGGTMLHRSVQDLVASWTGS